MSTEKNASVPRQEAPADQPVAAAESTAAAAKPTAAAKPSAASPSQPSPGHAGAQASAAKQPQANRRELTATALLALLGGVVAWVAAGRVWATGTAGEAPSTLQVSATGNDLSAAVTALGLTALAGALALFATRRLARRLVGVLLLAVGVGIVVNAAGARGTGHAAHVLGEKAASKGFAIGAVPAHAASWWLLAAVGGVLVAAAGVAALVRGAMWPGMSSRYENAASRTNSVPETGTAKDLWDALDRGEDPTEQQAPVAGTNH